MRPLSPVQESDSLCKIADRIYGDGQFWTQIYEGNREDVGKDASLLTAGTDLEMTVNASQADYAAMRRGGLVGGGLGVENGSGYPPHFGYPHLLPVSFTPLTLPPYPCHMRGFLSPVQFSIVTSFT